MAETQTLKVGDEAPDFDLPASPTGDRFKLSDYRGKNAVVINFVPAAFSPACSNQLPLIEQKRAEFESQGALPVVISTDNAWSLMAWKQQTKVQYPVLSDFNPHGAVSKAYGVYIDRAGVANRIVVVVDKEGKVAWVEQPASIAELPDYDPVFACMRE